MLVHLVYSDLDISKDTKFRILLEYRWGIDDKYVNKVWPSLTLIVL
jgi:hypothetical protein